MVVIMFIVSDCSISSGAKLAVDDPIPTQTIGMTAVGWKPVIHDLTKTGVEDIKQLTVGTLPTD